MKNQPSSAKPPRSTTYSIGTALLLTALVSAPWAACNSSGGGQTGTGGHANGGSATGGTPSSGGAASTGGTQASGGVTSSGGMAGSGGKTATGGSASGGSSTSGGSGGSGGSSGSSGATTSGGASGTGGRTGAGGTASGDAAATGGAGTAGAQTGGAAGSGGAQATGGARMGGTTGSGGASSSDAGATGGTGGSTVIAATPPMGWNSWNKYGCNGLNETVVKAMADAFITSGMKDAGYEYVNLDDCWMDGRDSSTGKIKVSASKFPSGIAALADYVHGKGLKIGIYSTPNTKSCAGLYGGYAGGVGSVGHETTDAQTYASWGIDYLKYDKCQGQLSAFAVMRDALKATGRPIVYSINPGDQGPYCVPTNCSIDLPKIANLWRIEFDIAATWGDVTRLIDANKKQYVGAGPGHWNDPDMLEVGNGLNDTEGRAHFSMWAIMASPLITGNDLSAMSTATKAILTNKEVIAVNQDPLGQQGRVVATPGTNLEVWSKEMTGTNTRAVALFNRGTASASITVKWSDIGLPAGAATVRDLWAAKDVGPATDSYTSTSVPSHSVVMLKVVSTP